MSFVSELLNLLTYAFVFAFVAGVLAVAVMYVIDITQTRHAIRRNFPVIGRFRYIFENMGEFFRQYFFAMDREELPFNRAERAWAYRAAKGVDSTVAFGSTRDLRPVGTPIFVNAPFPVAGRGCPAACCGDDRAILPDSLHHGPVLPHLGDEFRGDIPKPAVQALSRGARAAGCWLNTGEGGLAPYHLEGGADIVLPDGYRQVRGA